MKCRCFLIGQANWFFCFHELLWRVGRWMILHGKSLEIYCWTWPYFLLVSHIMSYRDGRCDCVTRHILAGMLHASPISNNRLSRARLWFRIRLAQVQSIFIRYQPTGWHWCSLNLVYTVLLRIPFQIKCFSYTITFLWKISEILKIGRHHIYPLSSRTALTQLEWNNMYCT